MRLSLNPASLNVVRPELALLIKQAQSEFELCRQPGSAHGLDTCRSMLAQIDGVFRLLELVDAARLAAELNILLADTPATEPRCVDAASRVFFILARYLDYTSGRRTALPELLIDDINKLRGMRKQAPIADGFFAEQVIGAAEVHCPGRSRGRTAADEPMIRRIRHMYQTGLLGVLKGRNDPVHLGLMQRALERALRLAGGGEAGDYWWLMNALIEGFVRGDILSSLARVRLLSKADRAFRDFASGKPATIDAEARQEILYLLRKGRAGPRAAAVLDAFGLDADMPDDTRIRDERRLLMGTSADTVDSIVRLLRGDLHRIKDELEQAGATGEIRAGAIGEMSSALQRVAEALREGGLRSSAATLDAQLERIQSAARSGQPLARHECVTIADALVYVETTLSGLSRAQGLAKGMREQQSDGVDADGVTREALEDARITMFQAARACIEDVKRAVAGFVEDAQDGSVLASTTEALDWVRGGLLIVERHQAAAVTARVAQAMGSAGAQAAESDREAFAEALADVLICLEYYLAALENGEEPDQIMLKLAEESLVTLGVGS